MKPARYSNWKSFVITCIATAFCWKAAAIQEVSNLGNQWPSGSIGDIHGVFQGGNPYGNDEVGFTTGASAYALNSVTLELFDANSPGGNSPAQALNVQLFLGSSLLGQLANPVASPTPTQWPQASHPSGYTTFFNFAPATQITLNPNSQYTVVISMPAGSGVDAALMFTQSSAYTSHDGWLMGPTSTGNPFTVGEYLKFGVNATAVPDGANTAVLLSLGLGVMIWCPRKFRRKTVQTV